VDDFLACFACWIYAMHRPESTQFPHRGKSESVERRPVTKETVALAWIFKVSARREI